MRIVKMPQLTNNVTLGGGDVSVKTGISTESSNYVLDVGIGVKAIYGIEGTIKIGITGKK